MSEVPLYGCSAFLLPSLIENGKCSPFLNKCWLKSVSTRMTLFRHATQPQHPPHHLTQVLQPHITLLHPGCRRGIHPAPFPFCIRGVSMSCIMSSISGVYMSGVYLSSSVYMSSVVSFPRLTPDTDHVPGRVLCFSRRATACLRTCLRACLQNDLRGCSQLQDDLSGDINFKFKMTTVSIMNNIGSIIDTFIYGN